MDMTSDNTGGHTSRHTVSPYRLHHWRGWHYGCCIGRSAAPNLAPEVARAHGYTDRQVQVQVQVRFTSVDGQVQPLDVAPFSHSVLSKCCNSSANRDISHLAFCGLTHQWPTS
jgi:hypothetical protein